jgi:hypothetical protein
MIREERTNAWSITPTLLFSGSSADPDHDAAMRIGVGLQPADLICGEVPGGGPILRDGVEPCLPRITATSDRYRGPTANVAAAHPMPCDSSCRPGAQSAGRKRHVGRHEKLTS